MQIMTLIPHRSPERQGCTAQIGDEKIKAEAKEKNTCSLNSAPRPCLPTLASHSGPIYPYPRHKAPSPELREVHRPLEVTQHNNSCSDGGRGGALGWGWETGGLAPASVSLFIESRREPTPSSFLAIPKGPSAWGLVYSEGGDNKIAPQPSYFP